MSRLIAYRPVIPIRKIIEIYIKLLGRGGLEDTRLEAKNSRPRPRAKLPRIDSLNAKYRNARGQEPRTNKVANFPQNAADLKKKKVFAQKFAKFPQKSSVSKRKGLQNFFSQVLWRASRQNKLFMTLARFQQIKK